MTRKRRSPSFVQMGKANAPLVASVSLNLLDLLDLKLNQTHHKCPRCGSFSSADSDRCPFCNEPLLTPDSSVASNSVLRLFYIASQGQCSWLSMGSAEFMATAEGVGGATRLSDATSSMK